MIGVVMSEQMENIGISMIHQLISVGDGSNSDFAFETPLTIQKIKNLLQKIEISEEESMKIASFAKEQYYRKSLYKDKNCEILVLGWLNGQRSRIHDHKGTLCGLKVLHGQATETEFDIADNGYIYAAGSKMLNLGEITTAEEDDVHQISNLQSGNETLVTLHVYSPPLNEFNLYSLEKGTPEKFCPTVHEAWFYEI